MLKHRKHCPINIESNSSDLRNILCNSLNIIRVCDIYSLFSNGPPPMLSTVTGFFLLTIPELQLLFLEICNIAFLKSVPTIKKSSRKKGSLEHQIFCSFLFTTEKSLKVVGGKFSSAEKQSNTLIKRHSETINIFLF